MNAFVAEILGTMMLILLGNGVVANVVLNKTKGNDSGWIVITFGWGMAVFVGVWIAGPFSGAHLNPAVSIALAASGAENYGWDMVPTYILAQFIGAALGQLLVWLTYRDHYQVTEDQGGKLATFCTAPAIKNTLNNLITEIVGTFALIFAVLFAAGPTFTSTAASDATIGLGTLGALPVGLLVLALGLSLGGPTGYAINPARDLGPRIMHAILPIPNKGDSDWGYAWIPVVGPIIGGLIAVGVYMLL